MDAAASAPAVDRMVAAAGEANRRVVEELMQQLANPHGIEWAGFYREIAEAAARDGGKWQEMQQQYYQAQLELFQRTLARSAGQAEADQGEAKVPEDRRFAAAEWREYPLFDYLRQSYQLTSDWLMNAVSGLDVKEDTRKRLTFYTRQYLDAVAPSNFPATNPEVLKLALDSGGENFSAGLKNLLEDLEKGRMSMTDESVFEVGRNIAVTPGAVVFENEMFQLIQYAPTTDKVAARPLLMVPPCINKFYIMDLEPENSLVRHALDQGHTVFLMSWRNIGPSLAQTTFDDYVEKGVIVALRETLAITRGKKVDTLGFCIGGTLLAMALAVLAARGEEPAATLTLMTTLLDFSDVGDIRVYLDENFVSQRERKYAGGGIVSGRDLAMAFSSLRANDLIWSYVVNNYLKGRTPEPFNLLFWNSDATNLPGPMYAWYVRNLYLENRLADPGALSIGGTPVDLSEITCPAFVFAAREDHIVPWRTAFESAALLGGEVEFVLGASGHIAGAINPARRNKRNHWTGSFPAASADAWLEHADSVPGSWWNTWTGWLDTHKSGKPVAARSKLGDARHPPIEDAPGRYVRVRSEQAE
ncbi:MAG: class I poly(R)-hydroxyalkanoic acid synthase [Pseudomonadota bacterium]|nr:class I poly(R)-hydroxyalkanoic acid synthase [Pseudomonadota bacterium]